MRVFVWFTVYVVAFSIGYAVTEAAEQRLQVTRITPLTSTSDDPPVTPASSEALIIESPEFCFSGFNPWRAVPQTGALGSAASGYQHFSLPMHRYTQWYRPRAATLTPCRRCEQNPFRPRGLGHLFARPCDGYRIEFTPHAMCDGRSRYGPAYIARQPDPRCDHCDHSAHRHHH